jgi:hypothetical protein
MLEHIERLKAWQALDLPRHRAAGSPEPAAQDRPRGRPDDARRPGEVRAAAALRDLVALAIEGMATVTDEIIDLHDRILASCSMPPRTSISSSSRHPARRSTPRCGCSGASARR